MRLPFNVARPAAVAVLAALDDREFIAAQRAKQRARSKPSYPKSSAAWACTAYPSAANFVAVEVPVAADTAYQALLEAASDRALGDGLGMPGRLRVSIGTPDENRAFIDALESLLAGWRSEPAGIAGATI